jgi:predicted nucleotidyltransferase
MDLAQLHHFAPQIIQIANQHGIRQVYVSGSVARGESTGQSDVDLMVEMQEGASLFGVAGFGYEVEKVLNVHVDVIPRNILSSISDKDFVESIQKDAIAL